MDDIRDCDELSTPVSSGNLMDTKTSHLDDIIKEKLEAAFHKPTSHYVLHDIAKIACEHSPIDLAHAASSLPPDVRPVIYENLSSGDDKVAFMLGSDSVTRVAVLRHIGDEGAKELVERMSADDAAFVLDDTSERRFRRVMEMLGPEKRDSICAIVSHDRGSAARLMTSQFFAFPRDLTIGEAAEVIRDIPGVAFTHEIYVLGDDGELQGYVPARNLIINDRELPLRQVMREVSYTVDVDASRDEVVDLVERYKLIALPVLDGGKLVGVVTAEEVIDAMEDIADATLARMAGTSERVGESETLSRKFFSRSPWLFITMLAGLASGTLMSKFQGHAGGFFTFLLFFVPLISGLSGNIGIQCSTVLVRSLATGGISAGNRFKAARKELLIGVLSGLAFGALAAITIAFLDVLGLFSTAYNPFYVGVIVSTGLIGACFAGAVLGVCSPLFFARVGVDPAVASGPIITALNDFLSMSIYFLISLTLSSLLLV